MLDHISHGSGLVLGWFVQQQVLVDFLFLLIGVRVALIYFLRYHPLLLEVFLLHELELFGGLAHFLHVIVNLIIFVLRDELSIII